MIEIKLGGNAAIETGAATLKRLARLIDTSKMRTPSFLAVLTGVGDFAYQRPDGDLSHSDRNTELLMQAAGYFRDCWGYGHKVTDRRP